MRVLREGRKGGRKRAVEGKKVNGRDAGSAGAKCADVCGEGCQVIL